MNTPVRHQGLIKLYSDETARHACIYDSESDSFSYTTEYTHWLEDKLIDTIFVKSETPGYHLININKSEFGTFGKIKEEVLELEDSLNQSNKIMALCELSDLYGAINGFIERQFPDMTMDDLRIMSEATARAFKSGHRS